MLEKTGRMLEFYTIKDMLEAHCHFEGSKVFAKELEPLINIERIQILLKETEEAVSMILRFGNSPIHFVEEVRPSLARAYAGSVLGLKELLDIARNLKSAAMMKRYMGSVPEDEELLLHKYSKSLYTNRNLEQDIFNKILSEEEIADNASPALNSVRRQILDKQNSIKDKLNSILHSQAKAVQDAVVTMRGERYCIPVKLEYKASVPGIVHDTSASGQTLFIEPQAIVETNNKIRELKVQEEQETERILASLSAEVSRYHEEIKLNYTLLSYLDFTFAKAVLALEQEAVKPDLNEKGYISIVKGRHPLLDKKKVVPITFKIGEEYSTLVITGPNTGGKTVALKTVGLFTLMVQSGLLIPAAAGSSMSIFEGVFADIGDEQSISQNLSTFSAHMKNIVEILEKADHRSLILFDELGAGTDPTEGAALAMSILECVHQMGATTVATTHYSELKVFASTTKGFENGCCEFDVETLRPTYRLLIGIPGRSNAFAISGKMGLDQVIISRAKELISAEDLRFEDMLSNIEKARGLIEEEKENVRKLRKESEILQKQAESEKKAMAAKKEQILTKAREEARRVVNEAKDEADAILKTLRKEASGSKNLKNAEESARNLNSLKNKTDSALYKGIKGSDAGKAPERVSPGDMVKVVSMNQTGEVLKAPDNDGNVYVQLGIMKVYIPISDLRMSETLEQKEIKAKRNKETAIKSSTIKTEVDVRGCNVDEAIVILDKYLDDAMIAHLKTFSIIHGKGTGALRSGIHQYLRQLKSVKSFRLGAYGEGDAGVTVVTLK
ncbi:MAG: endonuclease MutS2 [Ruminococcaceae bacterium]|nr:endonuclease MutS2 [Oscillospiraceae bacterium]